MLDIPWDMADSIRKYGDACIDETCKIWSKWWEKIKIAAFNWMPEHKSVT